MKFPWQWIKRPQVSSRSGHYREKIDLMKYPFDDILLSSGTWARPLRLINWKSGPTWTRWTTAKYTCLSTEITPFQPWLKGGNIYTETWLWQRQQNFHLFPAYHSVTGLKQALGTMYCRMENYPLSLMTEPKGRVPTEGRRSFPKAKKQLGEKVSVEEGEREWKRERGKRSFSFSWGVSASELKPLQKSPTAHLLRATIRTSLGSLQSSRKEWHKSIHPSLLPSIHLPFWEVTKSPRKWKERRLEQSLVPLSLLIDRTTPTKSSSIGSVEARSNFGDWFARNKATWNWS